MATQLRTQPLASQYDQYGARGARKRYLTLRLASAVTAPAMPAPVTPPTPPAAPYQDARSELRDLTVFFWQRIASTQAQASALAHDLNEMAALYDRMAAQTGYADAAARMFHETYLFYRNRYQALVSQMAADRVSLAAVSGSMALV